jgi:hypothetical protein
MSDHRKLSHNGLFNLLNDIHEKAKDDPAEFGLTAAIIDIVKDKRDGMGTRIADQTAKKAAAKASTTALKTFRKGSDDAVSDVKIAMRAAKVPADKFVQLGFDADDLTPSAIAVSPPSDLVVQGFSNGTNELKFNRNGNKQGTVFIIEAKIGSATEFAIVGTTQKQTFRHTGQKPGVKTVYRVRAQRGDDLSEPSNEAVVYEQ